MTRDFDKEPTTAKERDCATYGHCWHVRGEQHTIGGGHRDDICCWCVKSRCVSFIPMRPTIPDGESHRHHGYWGRGIGELIGWEDPKSLVPAPAVASPAFESWPKHISFTCKTCSQAWVPLANRTSAELFQLLQQWAQKHEHA